MSMKVRMMKSKIHRASVTQADLHYEGSISIDADFLDRSNILPYEQVDILNVSNGERFTTYAIEAPRGSKTFGLNGAAARRVHVGDKIIIVTYCDMDIEKARNYTPKVVLLDENNDIVVKTKH
ncbi:MAG: aspartate 1-decarboxylase [Robiginitomaculum sp.]